MPVEPTARAATGSSMRMGLDVRRLPWVRPLAGDYAFNFPKLASLYAGDPSSTEAWREAIARTRAHDRRRSDVVRVIEAQQSRRDAPAAARSSTRTLLDPSAIAIVTGQQAGAFGGPFFTILKALTTIQLAQRVAREHNVPAVPVFWVDAEDHDWEEVASSTVLDGTLQPRTITLPPFDGAGELPVAALRLDERIEASLSEFAAALAETDFTEWTVSAFRRAYRPGAGMADAFARWLEGLLGPHGLIVFESADPAAKPLASGVFTRELEAPGRSAELAAAAGEALAARGHAPQVHPQPGSVSLFRLDGGRRAIKKDAGGFVIVDRVYSAGELSKEAASSPERFSPNVLLRPVVQDTLFPTAAYVAGPSELAYLGQLKGIYEHFGVPMPLMYPRATATLLDSASAKFLAKYNLPLPELQAQDESALNRLLESQLPRALEESLKDAEEAIRRSMQRVIDEIPALDPTLAGAARTVVGKMEHELRGLRTKMIHAAKKRDETLRRQFTRAQAQAFPQGQPQERALGSGFFLNRYGPALIDRLLEELPLELGKHWVLTI